jgi:hypothetical protein
MHTASIKMTYSFLDVIYDKFYEFSLSFTECKDLHVTERNMSDN